MIQNVIYISIYSKILICNLFVLNCLGIETENNYITRDIITTFLLTLICEEFSFEIFKPSYFLYVN